MINILLDELPVGCRCSSGRFYELDFDFRIGIQVQLAQDDPELTEREKLSVINNLIFEENIPETAEEIQECISFYLNGWNHDNPSSHKENKRIMDYDIDQWRIFAAFYSQYNINLNTADLHYWAFMGLLSSLNECSYTRVIDIRTRNIDKDMDKKAKKALIEAKEVYEIRQIKTAEEALFEDYIDDLLCQEITPREKERIRKFESFGKEETEEGQPQTVA